MQLAARSELSRKTRAPLAVVAIAALLAFAAGARADAGSTGSALPLKTVARVPLSGAAIRFDYTSLDPTTNKLWISHMNASQLLAFDVRTRKIVKTIPAPGVHGVISVPSLGRVFASATDAHEVFTINAKTGAVLARAPAGAYPDGLAYDPVERHVFISDETGGVETVINARGRRIATISLGGEAGNVQYDAGSGRILVDVQTRGDIAIIDPRSNRIVRRLALDGCASPHGLLVDSSRRLAFIACDANARLLTLDLRTMRVTGNAERRRHARRPGLRHLTPPPLRLGRERRRRGLRRARTQPHEARPGDARAACAHRRRRFPDPPRLLPARERIDRPAAAADHETCVGSSPGSVVETIRQESQVIFRITSVITRPMIGSPIGAPSETTIALAMTPSETKPSTRAWLPSAISAGLKVVVPRAAAPEQRARCR